MRLHTSVCLAAALITFASSATAVELGHLQTDKPAYRLGETLWWRAHVRPGPTPAAATVRLVGPTGATLAERALDVAAPHGAFLIEREWPGGPFRVDLLLDGALAHSVSREVYDVVRPALDLSLRVLGELHEPGADLVASFRARDLQGRPLVGATVRWRATFGARELTGQAGPTDAEGRALVRVRVPEGVAGRAHLACGLEVGRARAAVAATVRLSASVGAVDLFPEGGGVLAGYAQRLGVLVRDLDGEPTPAEGRVEDDQGAVVASFVADRRGLALVEVPFAQDRTYRVKIDRPAGMTARFPVPAPTGHAHVLRVDVTERGLTVTVRGARMAESAQVVLHTDDTSLGRLDVRVREDGGTDTCTLPLPYDVKRVHATLLVGGRATQRRTTIVGTSAPVTLELAVREGTRLPGEEVVLDVRAMRAGRPAQADLALSVYRGALAALAPHSTGLDLAGRAALGPAAGVTDDVSDLLVAREGEDPSALQARRDAFALVHDAVALPPAGVALDANGLLVTGAAPAPRTALAPRALAADPDDGRSRTRADALDLLLRRAVFTRVERPRAAAPDGVRFEPNAPAERLDDAWGLGQLAKRPPQEARPSGLDTRDTLCWVGRLVTDAAGRGVVRFRLSHEVDALAVDVQGFAGAHAVAARGQVTPQATFATRFDLPAHLTVGDTLELLVDTLVNDRRDEALDLRVAAPPCLEPLDRVEVALSPRRDAKTTKFRFRAVAPATDATFVVTAARGPFREVTRRPLIVGHRQVEVTRGTSGRALGGASISVPLPATAVQGSVRVKTQVYPTPVSEAVAGLDALLREPHGCMEQTTAASYPNIVVLKALLGRPDADPAVLERAYALARTGYERVQTFQHPQRGGFSLWPGGEPELRYTCIGLAQLAAHAQVFGGEGTVLVQRALDWLERQEVAGFDAIYVAFACAEAGVAWSGAAAALSTRPETACERALLANAVALWRTPWPLSCDRLGYLQSLVEDLQPGPEGSFTSEGTGAVFSRYGVLTEETTALAAVALHEAGRSVEAQGALAWLDAARRPEGGWSGTHATVLAVRALAHSFKPAPDASQATRVRLVAGAGSGVVAGEVLPTGRPLVLERAVDPGDAESVRATLSIEGDTPVGFSLALTYRVAEPVASAPRAPYALRTRLDATVPAGSTTDLVVELRRTAAERPAGQVVARLGIPGGCVVDHDRSWLGSGGVSRVEVADGFLTLYFTEAPRADLVLRVPLRATAPGHYQGRPSVVYPYYEAEAEAYAPGLELRVLSPFDLNAAAAAAAAGR